MIFFPLNPASDLLFYFEHRRQDGCTKVYCYTYMQIQFVKIKESCSTSRLCIISVHKNAIIQCRLPLKYYNPM